MKKLSIPLYILFVISCLFSCTKKNTQHADNLKNLVEESISFAVEQYSLMIATLENSEKNLNPRTFVDGKTVFVSPEDWTSGFFPGSLWYLFELTGDEKWKTWGIKYTEALDTIQYYRENHDVGFMIGCSYGNAFRLTGNEDYKKVIIQTARSLSTRYNPVVGLIQSWNVDPSDEWKYPVIIDNMMNLELLFDATEFSGDSTFYHIAISHADNTIKNHYRPDYSTWHVIDYSPEDGSVRHRNTHQGYSDESSWARGQSWGAYGYVMCYRKTKDSKYLTQAERIFDFIANHPNYPEDGVPYWDFNAPGIPDTYRDASAGAILASALYEISLYSNKRDYKAWGDKIMESLSSSDYLAMTGENGNFMLKHSVGSLPHHSEVDVPLNYADYYYLEALKRKEKLDKQPITPILDLAGYQLVFHDEFNHNRLDTTIWGFHNPGKRRSAINVKEACLVNKDGELEIRNWTEINDNETVHYAGMVETKDRFTFGYYEARIKFDIEAGSWGAFWIMYDNFERAFTENDNPQETGVEIDIIEFLPVDNGYGCHNLHWNGYKEFHKSLGSKQVKHGQLEGYHIYGLLWTPVEYAFYIDGEKTMSSNSAISHVPEYVILSTEIEDKVWAGDIPESGYGSFETTTNKMFVDYIRIFQKK